MKLIQRPSFSIIQCVASGFDYYMLYDKYPDLVEFRKLVTETIRRNQEVTEEQLKILIEAAEQLLTIDLSHVETKQPRVLSQSKLEQKLPNDEVEFERVWREFKKLENIKRNDTFDEIIGKSQAIKCIIEKIKKLKDKDTTVLITGESGTGKELIAKEIHKNSLRKGKAFVTINCAAIPETLLESELFGHEKGAFTGALQKKIGKFEYADKGTLFLDEIGEMSFPFQAKMLRVIEEQDFERIGGNKSIKVNVRIITATNKILEDEVNNGKFRKDLYYRVKVYPIYLPPLRERKEDIPLLVEHFLKFLEPKRIFKEEAMKKLIMYDWPGNIRELKNCIKTAHTNSEEDIISEKYIEFPKYPMEEEILYPEISEKQLMIKTIRESKTVEEAIRKLNMKRSTFYYKCNKYGIKPKNLIGLDR